MWLCNVSMNHSKQFCMDQSVCTIHYCMGGGSCEHAQFIIYGKGGGGHVNLHIIFSMTYMYSTTIGVKCLLSVEFMTHPYQRIRLHVYYLIMDPTT